MTDKRVKQVQRTVVGGCLECHGTAICWSGPQAIGTAALHHDRTGHMTWCDVMMTIRYGALVVDARQTDIEDAIASASSGGEPGAAPLPDPDAPTVPAAGVSAPTGRPVETSRHAGRRSRPQAGEHVHA